MVFNVLFLLTIIRAFSWKVESTQREEGVEIFLASSETSPVAPPFPVNHLNASAQTYDSVLPKVLSALESGVTERRRPVFGLVFLIPINCTTGSECKNYPSTFLLLLNAFGLRVHNKNGWELRVTRKQRWHSHVPCWDSFSVSVKSLEQGCFYPGIIPRNNYPFLLPRNYYPLLQQLITVTFGAAVPGMGFIAQMSRSCKAPFYFQMLWIISKAFIL